VHDLMPALAPNRNVTHPGKVFSLPNRIFFMMASVKKSIFFTLKIEAYRIIESQVKSQG
jgi:hypothetical protein